MKKVIYYAPRIITILLNLLILSVTIDGAVIDFNFKATLMFSGLLLAAILLTILAWKKPKIGGVIFIVLGIATIVMMIVAPAEIDWLPIVVLGIPILLAGLMFMSEMQK